MDQDRVKGAAKTVVGTIKEKIGKTVGDKKTETEGRAQKLAGKAQNAIGSAKDEFRSIFKRD